MGDDGGISTPNFEGGIGGDKGGGDTLSCGGSSGKSTSFPLPLSIFGRRPSFSSIVPLLSSVGSSGLWISGEAVAVAVLRWISLRRWAMRSEMLEPRWGAGRPEVLFWGARRGEVVYLSLKSVLGANFAL